MLEAVQAAANPGINATIRDKYFSGASATPAAVFPVLVNLAQKHLKKLNAANRGLSIAYEKQMTELLSKLGTEYPASSLARVRSSWVTISRLRPAIRRRRRSNMSEPIKNRYEFVILFDVENGNPNGDPDAGNMPRVDPETGLGIVTDVCLKRKIRNYVETVKEDATGYRIYVKDGVPLNRSDAEAYAALDVDEKTVKEKKKADPDLDRKVRDWMCANFYDVRTFGAVMTTFVKAALNCGQVRGPVQLGFARSVEPVIPQEITITRVAITTEADAEKKGTEMGRKYVIPYGLYRCEGYVSANLARRTTGFSEEDLSLLWEAILNMFEHDHSAARGKMAVRELIVFQHDNELGCAPAWKLFEAVHVTRRDPGDPAPARSYQDYSVTVDEAALPAGITCRRMG